MPMATKLYIVGTYRDWVSLIKPLDLLITQSCEIMWETKNVLSPLPQYLLPLNLTTFDLVI